jgi:hypothetical protein
VEHPVCLSVQLRQTSFSTVPKINTSHSSKPAGLAALAIAAMTTWTSPSVALTATEINAVNFADRNKVVEPGPNPFIVKAQILLSRRSVSPGV